MPRLIVKIPYTKGHSQKASAHLKNYVKYMATREGAEKFPSTNFQQKKNYMDYIATRPRAERVGSHALFSGTDAPIVLSQVAEEVANHPGNVWKPIISLQREDAERLGYNNAQAWKNLLSGYAVEMAQHMKIPTDQFRWYAAFHDEGHHPHIHMVCYSADGRSGFLTKDGLAKIKSGLAKEIFQQELTEIYSRQTQRRDELTKEAGTVLEQLVQQIRGGDLESEKAGQLLLRLSEKLKSVGGKKQYGYLKAPLKNLVDEIVEELAKDPLVAKSYDLWYELREDVLRTYKDTMPERLPLSQQKEFKRIKNLVIQEAVRLGEYLGYFSPGETMAKAKQEDLEQLRASAERRNSFAQYRLGKQLLLKNETADAIHWLTASAEQGNQFAQYTLGKLYLLGKEDEIERSRKTAVYWLTLAANQGNQYAQYFLIHLDDFRQRLMIQGVTKILNHLGDLFQEQQPPSPGGLRVKVDHKLKRKLQEKKAAQGHKQDDHEPVMTS